MPSRRQEKISRVVRDAVSDAIANHLSDPRIEESLVSVTSAEVSADLRIANVYLSIFGGTEAAQKKTFNAIMHARKHIQKILAQRLQARFCPVLNIHRDDKIKKAMETMKLIEDLAKEYKDKDSVDQQNE
jgi:ribosome-binding factor A